jgi:hypothetical protein
MIIIAIFFIFYLFFGFFSIYFCIVTPHAEIPKSSIPARIIYWHGVGFLVGFIATAILTFSTVGAFLVTKNLGF